MSDALDPRFADQSAIFKPNWNVSPGTQQPIIGPTGPRVETWGFRPARAVMEESADDDQRAARQGIHKHLESALFTSGRVLVPADGWYEWLPVAGKKQPYFVQQTQGHPSISPV